MRATPLTVCLIASVLLSGCTRYVWMKPAGDPATFPADDYGCKQSAMASAPPVFQTYDPIPDSYGPERIYTRCVEHHNREVCRTHVTKPDFNSPPPETIDLNAPNRSDLYNACMRAHGWVLQAVEDPK